MQLIDIQSQLEQLNKHNIHLEVLNMVKSGKEATVYRVQNQDDGQIMALKVYKSHEMRSFRQNADYLAGMHIGSRTLRKAVAKKTKVGRDYIQSTWVDKEYRMLRKLNAAGAAVPEIYGHASNSILFEYIGDESPAPKLAEVRLSTDRAQEVFAEILDNIETFLRIGYIHGDLSAFNILYWQDEICIIDFPQSIDIIKNVNSWDLLVRDLENISKHFRRYFEISDFEVQQKFFHYRELMAQK